MSELPEALIARVLPSAEIDTQYPNQSSLPSLTNVWPCYSQFKAEILVLGAFDGKYWNEGINEGISLGWMDTDTDGPNEGWEEVLGEDDVDGCIDGAAPTAKGMVLNLELNSPPLATTAPSTITL